jgi:hypothetical protein
VLNLRFQYGCDFIVDDITGAYDFPFQDGLLGSAINAVSASGGLYFSSAANSGNLDSGTSGTWEGDFLNGGLVGSPTNGFIHNFGTAGSPTNFNTVTQTSSSGYFTALYWSDPISASTNDYDLYVLDSSGLNVVSSSVNWQIGAAEPIEIVQAPATGQRLVVLLASGAPRFLHIDTARGVLVIGTSGSTRGHNANVNTVTVAAVDTLTAYPGFFTGGAANPVEYFSSDGPRHMFYNPYPDVAGITPGNFLSTGGAVYQKPDVAAADDVSTTLPPGGLNPFKGTSAAAPHAAAIAALIKSYNTNLTTSQVRALLTTTALDIMAPGVDRDSGYGIAMPAAALQNTPAPPPLIGLVSPAAAAVGQPVFIYGFSFRTATSVQFNGTPAPFVSISNLLVVTTVPAGATTGPLTIAAPFGQTSTPFVVLPTPPPTNDNFVNAQILTGTVAMVAVNTYGATREAGEPNHAGNGGGKSVWYRWTAPGTGVFSLDTIGSSFETLLAVYTGNNVSSLAAVASDINSGSNHTSFLTFNAAAGTTYQIAVDGFNGAAGNAVLRLEPATTTVFSTQFEPAEGYAGGSALGGQNGWLSAGTGGNGIVSNFFAGMGQQAFLGFSTPTPAANTYVYRPFNYTVDTNNRPLLQFSATMAIVDSSNGSYDQFWWLVRNTSGHALFALQFDNYFKLLNYQLDTGGTQGGGTYFPGTIYTLTLRMDFGRNRWSAFLNGVPINIFEQALTTSGASLTLNDIEAIWVFNNTSFPGNNYLLFDNYALTAGPSLWPRILLGPQNQTVGAGSTVFLNGAAAGSPPLAYQWYFNSAPIPNATNASLALLNVTPSQTGTYAISVANSYNTITASAVVTVTNPPPSARLEPPVISGTNGVQLNLDLALGNTYHLQTSTNLVNWSTLQAFYANGPNALALDPQSPGLGPRFYRVVSP